MGNTALNRTEVLILTNKSGGDLTQGAVVVMSTGTASAFTTTTTSGYVNGTVGVILEPNGIANNATGAVAVAGYVPKINLSGSASLGDLFKTHTVAGQAVRHAAPVGAGDFGQVLGTGATPAATLWSTSNQAGTSGVTREMIFTVEGVLVISTGAIRLYNKMGISTTISQVYCAVGTAPTGANLIVDILKNNTTIFTGGTNRPVITATNNTGFTTTIDVPAFNDGDYLTMNVAQVGATIAGSNLSVHVIYA